MVHASYNPHEILELDKSAKEAGIIILGEMGVNPGLDHMIAKKIIDDAHEQGAEVTSYVSWVGGLPAPEYSNNPLGYKFSWTPRGMLIAGLNGAHYKINNQVIEVDAAHLYQTAKNVKAYTGLALEGYPNRDSLKFADIYGIPNVNTFFRGTLRYKGCCHVMQAFKKIGLINPNNHSLLQDPNILLWREFTFSLLGIDRHTKFDATSYSIIEQALKQKQATDEQNPESAKTIIDSFAWLGLFSDKPVNKKVPAPVDALTDLLGPRLAYKEGEIDLVIIYDKFQIKHKDGSEERKIATLYLHGEQTKKGYSAMSKSTGSPVGIAAQLILDGKIKTRGVTLPIHKEIYVQMLEALANNGIKFHEEIIAPNEYFYNSMEPY